MNKSTYERLIAENLAELAKLPDSLERDHIEKVLKRSIQLEYEIVPELQQRASGLNPKQVVCGIIYDAEHPSDATTYRIRKVLLSRRLSTDPYPDLWQFAAGGKVEPGESLQDALKRELHEELGITSEIVDLYATRHYQSENLGMCELNYFNCRIVEGDPRAIQVDEVRWFNVHELPVKEMMPVDSQLAEVIVLEARRNILQAICDEKAMALGDPEAPDFAATDDYQDTLRQLRHCASCWVPEARILGNVRAGDIVAALDEVESLEKYFELRRQADMRAIAMWRSENPVVRELVSPDHGDMVLYLLDQLDLAYYHTDSDLTLAEDQIKNAQKAWAIIKEIALMIGAGRPNRNTMRARARVLMDAEASKNDWIEKWKTVQLRRVRMGADIRMLVQALEVLRDDKDIRTADHARDIAGSYLNAIVPLLKDHEDGAPVLDMLVFCPNPKCHAQHVDTPEPEKGWTNPPHKSHLCHFCGTVFRLADFATNGVAAIATRGARDTWPEPSGGAQ